MKSVILSTGYENSINVRRGLFLAALSGVLLTFSFPKLHIPALAWIALVPLLISLDKATTLFTFICGLATGLIHYGGLMYWVTIAMHNYGQITMAVSAVILILLVFYLSLYMALFSTLLAFTRRAGIHLAVSAPVLWVALEYIRGLLLTGLPWENLSYSQYTVLPVIQIADILGNQGLSFYIVLVNAILAGFILTPSGSRSRKGLWKEALVLILISGLFWGYGFYRLNDVKEKLKGAPQFRAAVIQGNIRQDVKWSFEWQKIITENYLRLTREAGKNPGTDLIIWPETAIPFYFCERGLLSRSIEALPKEIGTDLLFGAPGYEINKNETLFYNSAYLVPKAGGNAGRYDKVHLVPFGEYVPFRSIITLSFAEKLVAPIGDFSSGEKQILLTSGKARIGTLICFESIFPELSRTYVKHGANLLVTITNDAWFGKSSAPYQHMSMSVFRAVENRVSLARAANTGISTFVLPTGELTQQTPLMVEAVIKENLPLLNERTIYTRIGDILPLICILLSGTVILISLWRTKNRVNRNRK